MEKIYNKIISYHKDIKGLLDKLINSFDEPHYHCKTCNHWIPKNCKYCPFCGLKQ